MANFSIDGDLYVQKIVEVNGFISSFIPIIVDVYALNILRQTEVSLHRRVHIIDSVIGKNWTIIDRKANRVFVEASS